MIRMGAWFLGVVAAVAPEAPPPPESVTMAGQVIELAEALRAYDMKVDPDPIARQVVLKGPGGEITPLLSDEASRALFADERLRHRRAVIRGRKFAGLPYLQV